VLFNNVHDWNLILASLWNFQWDFCHFLLNRRTVYAHHTFQTYLARKSILAPVDQLMATALKPRYSNCVRSVTDLAAQLHLDGGITFHYLFVTAHKSAPMLTPAPHSLVSFVLISRSLIIPVSQLPHLFYQLSFCCGISVIPCVPKVLRAMCTL